MHSVPYKLSEFFILFVLFPVSLVLNYPLVVKMCLGVFGFLYVLFVLVRIEKLQLKISSNLNWRAFWKQTLFKLLTISIVTVLYMVFIDADNLFVVVLNKPVLWVAILFIYSVFSVYPQELIYRTFFFKRYESLFSSPGLAIFMNAILFSMAHLLFKNTLVLFLTFCGGLLFAWTFLKTRSTLLVTIEHAIYGCWLFTVGMGSMLGFPS
ncbi:CPBP family intramembrane metalloprotease [Hanstruepera neustonica]|uniref:CPBP family intramembrane metalloprotease n=1 Tax=Hanstruepera neustonica TaxID=1445657 RepID=A0A2K1DXL4_9FLAO|nr:CPBP family intramembrane glutamic endopeptidase [Hanstruepera neustonica]PNQ72768.1 CPBP family intramembrane metalloprotease [Hanstruepera neustonica]